MGGILVGAQPTGTGTHGPCDLERAQRVDVLHLDRSQVGPLLDVDREPDVAGVERDEPTQHDSGADLGHLAERAAQGGSDDVGDGDALPRLGAHPVQVGEGSRDVDLHAGVDAPVARRAPRGHRDLSTHRGPAAGHLTALS